MQYDAIRNLVLHEAIRLDGRDARTVRPIWSEVGYLPSAHGSAIFTRGETQSLTTVTLGAKSVEQMMDGAFINGYNKFHAGRHRGLVLLLLLKIQGSYSEA